MFVHQVERFGLGASLTTTALVLGLLATLPGCDGATDSPASDVTSADGVAAKGIRDNRYCEVLLAFFQEESITAQVWGTQGLNACPPEAWATVDAMAIQTEYGAAGVVLNGPRYWTIDGATGQLPAGSPKLFGQLEMQQLATLSVAPGMVSSKPYVERTVLRTSKFEFFAGTEIYELVAPTGAVYVMQSYAQIVDATLTASDLPGLASRLKLPEGWQYRVRTLTSALQIETPGEATVVQDELQNSYSKYLVVP